MTGRANLLGSTVLGHFQTFPRAAKQQPDTPGPPRPNTPLLPLLLAERGHVSVRQPNWTQDHRVRSQVDQHLVTAQVTTRARQAFYN
jgi:hypothetical protein